MKIDSFIEPLISILCISTKWLYQLDSFVSEDLFFPNK